LTGLPGFALLQVLHALTFGACHLGAMHHLARSVPEAAGASAQTFYAGASAAIGGLAMLASGALYAEFGGRAYFAMALLSALGLALTLALAASLRRTRSSAPAQ
jgi:PPP family 3-phenylpropionic acid transporter